MSPEKTPTMDKKMQGAVEELESLIRGRYPQASFSLSHSADEPSTVHLNATVDVDDPDEVLDVVMDRVLSLQEEESLPLHVIPLRPLERVLQETQNRPVPRWSLHRTQRVDPTYTEAAPR